MTEETTPAATSGVKFPPPAIYLLCLAGGFLAGWLRPAAVWPAHALEVRTVGILLFVVGLVTALWAIVTFRAARTSPNPMRPTAALAFAGPYRFSRNPMYLAMAAASAGVALFFNALWPLLSVPVALAFISHFVVAREERYLTAKFGEEYLRYTDEVRRWL